jgi:hypothetical protein
MLWCLFLLALPLAGQSFFLPERTFFTAAHGLPANDVLSVEITPAGQILARTPGGTARFDNGRWLATPDAPRPSAQPAQPVTAGHWRVDKPIATAHAPGGAFWLAAPQGIARRDPQGAWSLWTAADGIPFLGFTSLAPARDGSVWIGTTKGAIHFDGTNWQYRQGLRWLPADHVRGIAVDAQNNAWFATPNGVGRIAWRSTTLAEKARFFEDEIDKRHRRTPYGYVLGVTVSQPGDASQFQQHDSDNDGLWTSMYGAGECFAFAATKSPDAKRRAKQAFEALRFLGTVTQGGPHPAPKGYVARTILPASAGNPNASAYTPVKDREFRATRDKLWKIMNPRWPLSASGEWYWKADTSSDELDGHYFFYALYYDLVAKDDPVEQTRVRDHVAALTDHLIDHNFTLTDHDGTPTRWGIFNPENLNQNPLWADDRGLNSLSILSYLKTAAHITGNPRYNDAARLLIEKHGYAQNVMIPKTSGGPGSGNQSDDEMAFMNFYHLLQYETDPQLRSMYAIALHRRWLVEAPELNPLFNYIAAAALNGLSYSDSHSTRQLTPTGPWREQSLDTLRRFPLDRFDWKLDNSHRADVLPLAPAAAREGRPGRGHRRNGLVLPIDERHVAHWNHDPWQLDQGGSGRQLADGAAFLLPYYMGLYHGFLQ